MTTSPKFVFYLAYLLLGEMAQMNNAILSTAVHQDGGFKSLNVGDNLTLECFNELDFTMFNWYKQTVGQKLQLISTTYRYSENTLHGEFKNDTRFTLESSAIHISDVQLSDSATYICLRGNTWKLEIKECITVGVRGSELNMFGNGTKLDFDDEVDCHTVSVYFMSGALIFTTILSVVLAFLLYKRNCCRWAESCAGSSAPSTANTEVNRDTDDVHYAAVSVNLPNRSRRQRDNTMEQCVYSSVRQ